MFLEKLYSEPENVFGDEPIIFERGINLIFGKKDFQKDPKKSLNGIGKSLLLDFIDFCLLGSFQKRHSKRLHSAKSIVKSNKIVLEFSINDKLYVIKRSLENANLNIEFGPIGDTRHYSLTDLKAVLCELVFKGESYKGKFDDSWWRSLMPFFLKVEKEKKYGFNDPIKYVQEKQTIELNQYHFYLLNIDNSQISKNYTANEDLKKKAPTMKGVLDYIGDKYDLRKISDADAKLAQLNDEFQVLEKNIDTLKLDDAYADAEKQANQLTATLKELIALNYSDKQKLENYSESLASPKSINKSHVSKIYAESNELLGNNIKKTLDEAVAFRKKLIRSRQKFLEQTLKELEVLIEERQEKIEGLEIERSKIFEFLKADEAITDMQQAYHQLSDLREKKSDLFGQVKLYKDLEKEKLDIEKYIKEVEIELYEFIDENVDEIGKFRKVFNEVYSAIYSDLSDDPTFALGFDSDSQAKLSIDIKFPSNSSKGKNKGRTLVYDLSILLFRIRESLPGPRFLVHDGVFDGLDLAHMVHLYKYLESIKNPQFQYFFTFNEAGELDKKFGVEHFTNDKLDSDSIKSLSPSNKLIGQFD